MLRDRETAVTLDASERHPAIKEMLSWFIDEGSSESYERLPKFVSERFYVSYYSFASEIPDRKIFPANVAMEAARETIKEIARRAENEIEDKEAGRGVFTGNGYTSGRLGTEFSAVATLVRVVSSLSGRKYKNNTPEIQYIPDSVRRVGDLSPQVEYDIVFGVSNLARSVVRRLNTEDIPTK